MTEFKLYNRIINGDLRPNLEQFSEKDGLKKLNDEFYTRQSKVSDDLPEKLLESFDLDFHGFRNGDKFELNIDTGTNPIKMSITRVPNPDEEELINIDIPPPIDEKSEIFFRIIEDEYRRIKASMKSNMENGTSADDLIIYANKNVQIAKRIAKDSHKLEKKLRKEGVDNWENPNTLIIYSIKRHLIYSLLYLQDLYEPYIKKIQNENELRDELFELEHTKFMSKHKKFEIDMNKRHLDRLYNELGDSATKIDFFREKVKSQMEHIDSRRKGDHGPTYHDVKMGMLYEEELGNLLAQYYFNELIKNSDSVILEKYQRLKRTIADIKLNTESIDTKALKKVKFFEKMQIELDFLRENIEMSNLSPPSKTILDDLVSLLIIIQSRKSLNFDENRWNDYLTDLLRVKNYYVTDQTRSGESGSTERQTHDAGELDIAIRDDKTNGIIKTIIESLCLSSCGLQNKTVEEHINKLLERYDTAGNEENYLIIYANAVSFENLWQKYLLLLNKKIFTGKSTEVINLTNIKKANMKVAVTKTKRNSFNIRIYHLFVNMNTN